MHQSLGLGMNSYWWECSVAPSVGVYWVMKEVTDWH